MQKAVELSPRNESYQINLANIYMTNRKVDDAITLLRSLANSENPGIANQASASLAQAEDFKERSKSFQPRIESRSSEGMGAVHNSGSVPAGRVEGKIEVEEAPRPVRFIKGKLAAVDCSAAPQALLSVVSGGRSLKLHINDSKHVVLLGADNFSCEWKNKSVALNYRERQDGDGDVVSLEIQ